MSLQVSITDQQTRALVLELRSLLDLAQKNLTTPNEVRKYLAFDVYPEIHRFLTLLETQL